jgi:hypothetical protein
MEKGAVYTGDARDCGIGIRHRRDVFLDLVAPDLEQEGAPGAARHEQVARMDFVQRRNRLMVAQQVLQVSLDFVVALLEFSQHREQPDRVLAAQRQLGHVAQDHVRDLEIEILGGLLRHPDMLGEIESPFPTDLVAVCMLAPQSKTAWSI